MRAVDAGELDDVDAIATGLGRTAAPADLRRLLADDVVPRLAAEAHGSVLLFQLPRVAPRTEITPEVLRPLARELAREPGARLTWMTGRPGARRRDLAGAVLLDAVRAAPPLGRPTADGSIRPMLEQVDASGTAAALLGGGALDVDVATASRVLLRTAAWSLLGDAARSGDAVPYGWTHCLTLPQAALGLAGACRSPRVAVAVAATHVLGFRAALATAPPPTAIDAVDPGIGVDIALRDAPDRAAAAAWFTPTSAIDALVTTLATRAACHRDAHVAKYTVACFDAASWDRAHRSLYLAAAAALHGWWAERGDDDSSEEPAA